MEKITSIKDRRIILSNLKSLLIENLGENIISVTVYGSSLNEDFCMISDFDILVVLKEADMDSLKLLRKIKEKFGSDGIEIDFSIHDKKDLPEIRKKAFWHNNRSVYMKKELELYGEQLIGKYSFHFNELDQKNMLLESVRVTNSLAYQARSLLINKELNTKYRVLMMKWCLYSSLYALASRGIYPINKYTALEKVSEVFDTHIKGTEFLKLKLKKTDKISDKDLENAYRFLIHLDKCIFNDYKNTLDKN